MHDVLIIGGGVSGVSCALLLGSALDKPYALNKKVGIIAHQKTSSLQSAVFNNAYGIAPGTLGKDLLNSSLEHLETQYPGIEVLPQQKIVSLIKQPDYYELTTLKGDVLTAKIVVLCIGAGSPMSITGLEDFMEPHQKSRPEKQKIQLKNHDHLVQAGLYVAGVLAGHRSQLSIAAGSGASVATDILTLWNNHIPTQVHDVVKDF